MLLRAVERGMSGGARTAGGVIAAILFALLAAWLFRIPIAETTLEGVLRRMGFQSPQIEIASLDPGRIAFRRIAAGNTRDVDLGAVAVRFRIGEALGGKVRGVEIGPGRITARRAADGALSVAGFVLKGESRNPPPFERLSVDGLAVGLLAPEGRLDARVDGAFSIADGGRFSLALSSASWRTPGARLSALTATGALALSQSGKAEVAGRASADVTSTLGVVRGLSVSVRGGGASWRDALQGGTGALAGRAEVVLDSAQIAAAEAPGLAGLDAAAPFRTLTVTGRVVGAVESGRVEIAAAGGPALEAVSDAGQRYIVEGLAGAPLFRAEGGERRAGLALRLVGAASGRATAAAVQKAGGPWRYRADAAFGPQRFGAVALGRAAFSAEGEADAALRRIEARIDATALVRRAASGDVSIEDAPFRGQVVFAADLVEKTLRIETPGAACLALERVRIRAGGAAEAALRNARWCADANPLVAATWSERAHTELRGRIGASAATLRLSATRLDGAPPDVVFRASLNPAHREATVEGALTGGRLALNDVFLANDARGAFSGRMDAKGIAATARLDGLRLSHNAATPQFSPVRAQGGVVLAADAATFRFSAQTPDGRPLGSGAGRHDLASGRGELQFATGRLGFSPGGLQIAQLLPSLRGVVGGATGAVAGDVRAAWGPRPEDVRTAGEFRLEGLSFRGPGLAVSETRGVAGDLRFDSLAPLRTDGPQTIGIGLIDLGALKLEGGSVEFDLRGDDRVRVVRGEFPWFGGVIGAYDADAPLVGGPLRFDLRARDVDLARIFDFLKIEGLSGEGRVEGVLPIVVEDGRSYVRGGEMRSSTPGTIRYAGKAAEAASLSNPQAKLAFDILRNLRYQTLAAKIDGPLDGDLKFSLLFEGSNDVTVADRAVRSPVVYRIALEAPLLALLEQAQVSTSTRLQLERAGVLPKKTVKE